MIPVILSGGSGTRLWPLSRPQYPKQFLSLDSELTLFQETLVRTKNAGLGSPVVVCNEEHRFLVQENFEMVGLHARAILLESASRNTAPAIAVAAHYLLSSEEDPILLVLPADHKIKDQKAFEDVLPIAQKMAEEGHIVSFGIKPREPNTEYGYIELGQALGNQVYEIKSFKEKPGEADARQFLESKNYLWNSGIFCFKVSTYLSELEKLQPEIVRLACESVDKGEADSECFRLDQQSFELCQTISIDYAIMEQTKAGVAVYLDTIWSDISSWNDVWNCAPRDEVGNAAKGPHILHLSQNNYVHSTDKLVALVGCENLVVINTQDAVLVAHKDHVQDVRGVVETLKAQNDPVALHHRTVYRPWGQYDSICKGERDQVKRITVKPGAKLSLQKHFHRSEHWIVVKGTAKVTKGNDLCTVTENESIYLPLGIVHALENPGKIPLELIEVQTGSYLGEDDIVRLEDRYGRA
ncbi:MAG: mannose-1-phosphate guanylyltransferase/mannose-6-phosphate isomerase [Nitrospira sp.]|nr:mannose-1-phosphate guanylyltransferase/mannose-6-phosphate isomerase [Nitrospira sp.]